jgi:biotin-dependent carboxylase-like uncharacterized protein
MKPALEVLSPGLMTTLQDLGRIGQQHLGIPVSGALDPIALRIANLVVDNPPATAALEVAYQGPTLKVMAASVRLAVAGAMTPIEILPCGRWPAGRLIPACQSVRLERGEVLRIAAPKPSAVLYLAVAGGFDVPPVLGSRSTYVKAGLGGFAGRAIATGDLLALKEPQAPERTEQMLPRPDLSPPPRFRVVLGPQDDHFTQRGLTTLLQSTYTVSPLSDRMGMRLEGPRLEHTKGFDIVSDGIAPGAIQVPGTGLPIVLLADRQSTGGYPKPAAVISADLPALGRLTPGQKVAFEAVTIEAAEAARAQLEADIAVLGAELRSVREEAVVDERALLRANLVSGVVSARERRGE